MEDIAEQIVRTARMMPSKTAVVLTCNDVSIAKVARQYMGRSKEHY